MERRIIQTELVQEDSVMEKTLRPLYLSEYIGQEKIKSTIKVYMDAAKQRKESLDHVLFYGPPGLGKTTLGSIIANEMGVNIKISSGPAIEKPGHWSRDRNLPYGISRLGLIICMTPCAPPAWEIRFHRCCLAGNGVGLPPKFRFGFPETVLSGSLIRPLGIDGTAAGQAIVALPY